jgi:hypothetical protein
LSEAKTGSATLYWAIGDSGFIYSSVQPLSGGTFSRSFGFGEVGTWQFKVTWPGDDTTNPAESNIVTVTVNKITPTFTLASSATSVEFGSVIRLTGTLSLSKTGTVTLQWARGDSGFIYEENWPINDGIYERDVTFSQAVVYQFRVVWSGDATSEAATSNIVTVTVTPAPSITVTSPNGGESWAAGSTHTITWTSTGDVGDNVRIDVLKNWAVQGGFTTANVGSCEWQIDVSWVSPGTDYRIFIESASNSDIWDFSDADFEITQYPGGSLRVTSPNGGESWHDGETRTITWSSTGNVGDNVKITLYIGTVNIAIYTVSSSAPNAGYFVWTIPAGWTGTSCKIEVRSLSDNSINDTSDNYFSIT